MGKRRKLSQDFKLEAVKLIWERGEMTVQASSDLGVQFDRLTRMWHSEIEALRQAWLREIVHESDDARRAMLDAESIQPTAIS